MNRNDIRHILIEKFNEDLGKRLSLISCLPAGSALAQAAKTAALPTAADVLNDYIGQVEGEFVPAAEAMPEDKYSFAPSNGEFKGVRTFAEQVKHVAAVNYLFGAAILQEKPPVDVNQGKGPDALQTKADIVQFLKDSFAYLHKSLSSVTKENLVEPIKNPFGDGTIPACGSCARHRPSLGPLRPDGGVPADERHRPSRQPLDRALAGDAPAMPHENGWFSRVARRCYLQPCARELAFLFPLFQEASPDKQRRFHERVVPRICLYAGLNLPGV